MKQIKQIVFTDAYKAEYLVITDVDFTKIGENEVVVKTKISTISAGTERANFIGDPNIEAFIGAKPKVTFPRKLGYSSAGEVVAVGKNVKKVQVGDRVVVYGGYHKNYNIVNQNNVVKIENENVSYQDAGMAYISIFPLAAIRKVKLELGESLMVMGLGILGQLAVMYARAGGAYPVIACDPKKERREVALKNGADYALNPLDKDFAEQVKKITNGGVKTAIEVTGVGAGLDETLDCMARLGRVALLGCTRNSDFSIDYYRKVHGPGITLIGAHTNARPVGESYPSYFTSEDDIKTALNLCASGRLCFKNLVEETHLPSNCQEVYTRLATDKNFPIGVQFNWENE